jgi:hypothetical protein
VVPTFVLFIIVFLTGVFWREAFDWCVGIFTLCLHYLYDTINGRGEYAALVKRVYCATSAPKVPHYPSQPAPMPQVEVVRASESTLHA